MRILERILPADFTGMGHEGEIGPADAMKEPRFSW
jgi:hypothetical protein